MRYSIEPRDRIYVKGYGFLSFAKNIGKNLSNKYSQEIIDTAKKSAMDAIKTASQRAIQKTAEVCSFKLSCRNLSKITCKDIFIIDDFINLTHCANMLPLIVNYNIYQTVSLCLILLLLILTFQVHSLNNTAILLNF